MSFCECPLDADNVISEISYTETQVRAKVKCEECDSVIPAGEPFVLYKGRVGGDQKEDDGLGLNWSMISCRLCHRMRLDLVEMGYCIVFPGLQELIERMEDESDLKDLAERRANSDMIAGWNRRLRHLSEIRFRDSHIHTMSYNYHIRHLKTVPPFYIMRNQEQDDKAKAMAEFWRKRAAWEEVDQH